MKEGNILVRIGLIFLWASAMIFTLLEVKNDCRVLVLTIVLIWIGMIATSEPIPILGIAEWAIEIAYMVFLGYIIQTQKYEVTILILASLVAMLVFSRRFKNRVQDVVEIEFM